MKKNKLLIFIVLLFVLFAFNVMGVNADYKLEVQNGGNAGQEVESFGTGNQGEQSSTCNTGFCGNTVGITIDGVTFKGTAVYGMRVTLVDKNGKQIEGTVPVNLWATDAMTAAVKKNVVKKHHANSYDNKTYKKLYEWKNHALGNIDESGNNNYSKFIDDLTADDVKKILELLSYNYGEAIYYKYFLKIEPIFVLHFHYYTVDYFLQGTPSEIYSIITYDNKNDFDDTFRSEVIKYFFKIGIDGWNVIKNYFFTTYVNEKVKVSDDSVNDNNFPFWNGGNSSQVDRGEIYKKWYNDGSNISGLATGYLWLPDKAHTSTIYITKSYGTPSSSVLDTTRGQACFRILYKDESNTYRIYGYGGKTVYCNHVSGTTSDDRLHYQQFSVKLPAGKYKIKEINVADNIKNVYFRQRTNIQGDYSLNINSYKIKGDEPGYESGERILKAGETYYFGVYNEFKKAKITVVKKLGTYSEDDNTYDKYRSKVEFSLWKCDSNGGNCTWKKSKFTKQDSNGDHILTFDNVEPTNDGETYKLIESKDSVKTSKVYFRTKNDSDKYNVDLTSNNGNIYNDGAARSKPFTVESGEDKRIAVFNSPKYTVTVIKKLGTYSSHAPYGEAAYFRLCDSKNVCQEKETDENTGTAVFVIDNPDDKYTLMEYNINAKSSSYKIKNVHFRVKKIGDGDTIFSGDFGGQGNIPIFDNDYFATVSFKYKDYYKEGQGVRIAVFNEPKEKTSQLYVYKKEGSPGSTKNYNEKDVDFKLCKVDNSEHCTTFKKPKGSNKSTISNLVSGYYTLEEISVDSKIKKVYFYNGIGSNSKEISSTVPDTSSNAKSSKFYIDANKIVNYITVFNEPEEEVCGCDCELDKIKDLCTNGICGSDRAALVISSLNDLYADYNNYNLILNYFVNKESGKPLDISKTTCGSVECSTDTSSNFSCQDGKYDYAPIVDTIEYDNDLTSNKVEAEFNKRVCYESDKSRIIHLEVGNAKCGVSFEYKFNDNKFGSVNVPSGNLLWRNLPNDSKIGELTVNLECSELFYPQTNDINIANNELNNNKILSNVLIEELKPYMSISSADSIEENFKFETVQDYDDIIPNRNYSVCSPYGDDEYACYAYWNFDYKFNISYNNLWYTKDSNGYFYTEDYYENETDKSKFKIAGYGLPIAIDTKKNNYEAILSFGSYYLDGDYKTTSCPYNVDNKIIDYNKKFNFDFRVIDTNNPFPGIRGDGRLTGENWCESSNIGKIIRIDENKFKIIGDINGDGIVNYGDYYELNNDIDKYLHENDYRDVVDINMDGGRDETDIELLELYAKKSFKELCSGDSEKNSIVKKYIIDKRSSNSTELPMYSFTLTPGAINVIREYNKNTSYDDFNLSCTDGEKCTSNFLSDILGGSLNHTAINVGTNANNSSCYETRFGNGINWCSN